MKIAMSPSPQLALMPSSRQASPVSFFNQTAFQSQQANVLVTTKEGDTVRISEDYSASMKTMALQGDGGNLDLLSAEIMNGSSRFIEVQGDLNSQELADLGSLLDDLSDIAGDFFKGNFDDAVAGGLNLGDLGTLAKVDASFVSTKSLATTLAGYHPMPDVTADLFSDLMAENKVEHPEPDVLPVNDRLKSQWQQFLGYLEEQAGVSDQDKNYRESHKLAGSNGANAEDAGRAMLARIQNTLQVMPRFAPLVPAIGDLAIDKAMASIGDKQANHDFVKELRHNFRDAFWSWMV